ncbi:flagellar filament capping protein FliD [Paenibacillus sp. GCM10012307]|uniref:Flagellar hook-associated protein 2 n=1 Tax=Paenibacillus roseus TaxID=2798579 RepID=A0A934IYB8_9BACL|nr:flagellar filament capping protein FliD [Paenibacillus roseus]MBJ6361501.1 flagellar filament capping protein FliD [Paenibacillus roseus]
MTLSINSYNLMNPINRTTSWSFESSNNLGANPSLFSKFASKSKSYEQYVKTAATGIANFLKSAQDLQASAQKLMQKDNSSFQARTAESSDSKKVTATALAGAASKIYEVKVNAIATSQTNSGTFLSKAETSVASRGINQFNITIGGKTTKASAVISDNDTNDQVLTKLKDAVNAAKTGITASIVTDDKTGNKKLELSSDKTGAEQAFEVEDVTGNAMSATGVKHATQLASNASYSVNGGATQVSQSNTIDLEKGKATATLLAPSMEAVKIQIKPDENKVIAQVKDMVTSYNMMHDRLKDAGRVMNSSVRKSMESLVSSSTYERIGIHRNGDGTLKLDEEQLKMSLSSNFEQTTKAISGNYGLADRLSSAAERYNEVPASSLLNSKARQVQQFAMYQSSMQIAMPTQASGWVVNLLY